MPTCWHCKVESPDAHYARVVENKTPLYGEFEGWRMSGRYLIAPGGERFTPRRLMGIAWAEKLRSRVSRMEQSRSNAAAIVLISERDQRTLPARERFAGCA